VKAIALIVLLALALLLAQLAAEAQQPGRVPRIGILQNTVALSTYTEAFRQGLRALGWVEGQNMVIESRVGRGYEHYPDLAAELVRLQVDVIFATNAPAIQAAMRATTTIPIVMVSLGDPVAAGFVASLARPGGNITGLSGFSPELSGKQLELLKEVVPNVARVAMLANPTNPHTPFIVSEAEMAARALGVQLHLLEVREPNELGSVFAAMTTARANALLVLPDPMLSGQSGRIVELAAQSRLPAMYAELSWAQAGGLMVYGVSLDDMNRRAATYVDKILKGAQPGDLPVERPVKFTLVINLKTAQALGLTLPPSLLLLADEVIR
jgi:ABC-type uncharacterized transport system substrate-binding protein